MSSVANLPASIQTFLSDQGIYQDADVTPMTVHQDLGDRIQDGQVSFHVRGKQKSGFLLVGTDNHIRFYQDHLFKPRFGLELSVFAPGISEWAALIDPPYPQSVGPQVTSIEDAEQRQTEEALTSLNRAMGKIPKGNAAFNTLREHASLLLGHPAKDFLEQTLVKFHQDITELEKISDPEKRSEKGKQVYGKYAEIFHGMKSVKTFYDGGLKIWEAFPHLQKKNTIHMLYPAAGTNVGALASAMAMIDQGAPFVDLVFTEVNKDAPEEALALIKQWAEVNPALFSILRLQRDGQFRDMSAETGKEGGTRTVITLFYKGGFIKLTYALKDSPKVKSGQLFFHPDDAKKTDIMMIHDPFSPIGYTEAGFLRQALPHLRRDPDSPTAILMTNELDSNVDFPLESIIPIPTWVVDGSFGHGDSYPLENKVVDWSGLNEIGRSHHRSALILSTSHPLLLSLKSKEEIDRFVDFSQFAGGSIEEVKYLSGDKDRNSTHDDVLKWAVTKLDLLKKLDHSIDSEPRQFFILVAARSILQRINELRGFGSGSKWIREYLDKVPSELGKAVVAALVKEGIMRGYASFQSIQRLSTKGLGKKLNKLDKLLKKKQRLGS